MHIFQEGKEFAVYLGNQCWFRGNARQAWGKAARWARTGHGYTRPLVIIHANDRYVPLELGPEQE